MIFLITKKSLDIWISLQFEYITSHDHSKHSAKANFISHARNMSTTIIESHYVCVFTSGNLKKNQVLVISPIQVIFMQKKSTKNFGILVKKKFWKLCCKNKVAESCWKKNKNSASCIKWKFHLKTKTSQTQTVACYTSWVFRIIRTSPYLYI